MPSVGSVRDGYDYTIAESFFASLEHELLKRRGFKKQAEGRMAIFEWLGGCYNPYRRHSNPGYSSPINYEGTLLNRDSMRTWITTRPRKLGKSRIRSRHAGITQAQWTHWQHPIPPGRASLTSIPRAVSHRVTADIRQDG